jgi:hypothetical protein
MLINDTSRMEWERLPVSSRNMRTSRKLLREGNALPGVGLYAVLVKLHDGEEAFTAPWHRHNFSQIRIGVKGHLHFGPNLDCEPGQVGFFPGGAYYGPEEIIGAEYLLLQWGRDWVTRAQDKAAIAELSKRGHFEHGMYYYTDEQGAEISVDGKQAVWEHVYGRAEVIEPPRYRDPIMMDPDAFDWIERDGKSVKSLGHFTEEDVAIEMVRWNRENVKQRLLPDRTTMVWVTKGTVAIEGHEYGEQTAIWSDLGEQHDIVGALGSEALVLGLPLYVGEAQWS